MSRWLTGAIGLLLLLVLLLATAPARLILSFLPADQVVLQGVSGTLWRGSSSRALVAVQGGFLHLGRLSWSLSPVSLLALAPRLTLDSRWGAQRIRGEVVYRSAGSISLTDVDALLPAVLVRQLVPVNLSGNFTFLLPRLEIEDGMPVTVVGRMVWENAGWVSPGGERLLGSYAVDFDQSAKGGVMGEIVTLSGNLEASGNASLDGRNYIVDILLSGSGLEDPQLRQALQLLALPEGERFRVKMEGSLQ